MLNSSSCASVPLLFGSMLWQCYKEDVAHSSTRVKIVIPNTLGVEGRTLDPEDRPVVCSSLNTGSYEKSAVRREWFAIRAE